MLTLAVVLFLIVVFVAGWYWIPKGRLTKITAVIGSALATMYEFAQEQFHIITQLVPPEYGPYFLGGFLALVIAAAVRPAKKDAE